MMKAGAVSETENVRAEKLVDLQKEQWERVMLIDQQVGHRMET